MLIGDINYVFYFVLQLPYHSIEILQFFVQERITRKFAVLMITPRSQPNNKRNEYAKRIYAI